MATPYTLNSLSTIAPTNLTTLIVTTLNTASTIASVTNKTKTPDTVKQQKLIPPWVFYIILAMIIVTILYVLYMIYSCVYSVGEVFAPEPGRESDISSVLPPVTYNSQAVVPSVSRPPLVTRPNLQPPITGTARTVVPRSPYYHPPPPPIKNIMTKQFKPFGGRNSNSIDRSAGGRFAAPGMKAIANTTTIVKDILINHPKR